MQFGSSVILSALKIAIIYMIVGALWIVLSDHLTNGTGLDPREAHLIQTIKGLAYVVVTGLMLFVLIRLEIRRYEAARSELLASYEASINGWVRALDLRHEETANHTQRVTAATCLLASFMKFEGEAIENIRRGAILHDIGKIGISDDVLTKAGPLTDEEWVIMRRHPETARDFIAGVPFLLPALDIPYCHHERWDGTGYPQGLKGEAIPLPARIFAIVDVWDALSHDRVYKKAWPREKVIEHITSESGKHFDPNVVEVFLAHLPELEALDHNFGSTLRHTPT